ncbi:MAG: hypothetical protein ACMV1B_11680 [Prevotella sp.]
MTYNEAIRSLEKSKTTKGHYKATAVEAILKQLTTTRVCPNCSGKGETHSPCAFGGSGDHHTCHVCEGIGRI